MESGFSIQRGMEVLSSDGQHLGSVAEDYGDASRTATRADLDVDFPVEVVSGEQTFRTGGEVAPGPLRYIRVHGSGPLGLGGHDLYVPYDVIAAVSSGQVHLTCSDEECRDRFGRPPEWVKDDPGLSG